MNLKNIMNTAGEIFEQIANITTLRASDGTIINTNPELKLYEAYLYYKNKLRCTNKNWYYCHDEKDFETFQRMYVCKLCMTLDPDYYADLRMKNIKMFKHEVIEDVEYSRENGETSIWEWLFTYNFKGPDYYHFEYSDDTIEIICLDEIKHAYKEFMHKFEFGIKL